MKKSDRFPPIIDDPHDEHNVWYEHDEDDYRPYPPGASVGIVLIVAAVTCFAFAVWVAVRYVY